MAIDFNASAQGRLRVDGQAVGVLEDDDFEHFVLLMLGFLGRKGLWIILLNIDSGKGFDFPSDELDAFFVGAVDIHDVGFHLFLGVLVDFANELIDNGAFAGAGITVEEEMGDFMGLDEIGKALEDGWVNWEPYFWLLYWLLGLGFGIGVGNLGWIGGGFHSWSFDFVGFFVGRHFWGLWSGGFGDILGCFYLYSLVFGVLGEKSVKWLGEFYTFPFLFVFGAIEVYKDKI